MNGNYGWLLPVAASDIAGPIDAGIKLIHVLMILIFVLWSIYFAYLLWTNRAREGHKARRLDLDHKLALAPDAAVLLAETLIILFFAIPVWSRIKMKVPQSPDALRVEVVGEQFNWTIRYPGADGTFGRTKPELVDFSNPLGIDPADEAGKDDVVAVNEMRLPVGRQVVADLTSKDVIHSFFVPAFRIKQDATPGLRVPVWFTPTKTGDYEITCAQLCGVGHAIMRADVKVQTPEDFDKWLASMAPAPEAAAAEVW